jgi:hypothetical protein
MRHGIVRIGGVLHGGAGFGMVRLGKARETFMDDFRFSLNGKYVENIRVALAGKRIVKILLPSPGMPFDEIVLVLENGNHVSFSASSDDGSGVLAFGLNVPSEYVE